MSRAATVKPKEDAPAAEPEAQVADPKCVHHWAIETPNGRESMGVCKRCGVRRSFSNSNDAVMWEQTNTLRSDLNRSGWRSSKVTEVALADES
ncbi:MAG: hypothetical protein EPO16_09915 [Dehalococcoidia bacterium]|nr:MAG: hypothetical protein EPO16_09915 [Dehalococcoidia bacterium]